jgi:predicted RNA-binding protein with PIN domain
MGPGPGHSERRAGGAVRIIYSAPGESADDVIERLLATLEDGATVYTADFALQRTALARGSTRATPREFASLLDELPATTHSPDVPRKSRLGDRLSLETLRKLEEIRRRGM